MTNAKTVRVSDGARARLVPIACLLVALGVSVLVAFIAPDNPGRTDLWQGLALGLVFAGPPIAALLWPEETPAFGGAMVITGIATTPGGNLLGPVMAASGLLLMVLGSNGEARVDRRLVTVTVASAVILYGSWILALQARS